MVNLWVWENILVPISVTLGQGHQATEAKQILPCLHDKVRTAHLIAAKLSLYIPLVTLSTIWGMIGPVDVSQKGNESTGCYADYGTFDFDLSIFMVKLYLWNETSGSNLEFAISAKKKPQKKPNGSIATKQKANISIERYASIEIIGFDLGHDLEITFSKSNMQFCYISAIIGPIAMKQKANISIKI